MYCSVDKNQSSGVVSSGSGGGTGGGGGGGSGSGNAGGAGSISAGSGGGSSGGGGGSVGSGNGNTTTPLQNNTKSVKEGNENAIHVFVVLFFSFCFGYSL